MQMCINQHNNGIVHRMVTVELMVYTYFPVIRVVHSSQSALYAEI